MAQIASEPPSWNTGSGAGSSFAEEVGANAISDDEDDSWLANDLVSKSLIASLTEAGGALTAGLRFCGPLRLKGRVLPRQWECSVCKCAANGARRKRCKECKKPRIAPWMRCLGTAAAIEKPDAPAGGDKKRRDKDKKQRWLSEERSSFDGGDGGNGGDGGAFTLCQPGMLVKLPPGWRPDPPPSDGLHSVSSAGSACGVGGLHVATYTLAFVTEVVRVPPSVKVMALPDAEPSLASFSAAPSSSSSSSKGKGTDKAQVLAGRLGLGGPPVAGTVLPLAEASKTGETPQPSTSWSSASPALRGLPLTPVDAAALHALLDDADAARRRAAEARSEVGLDEEAVGAEGKGEAKGLEGRSEESSGPGSGELAWAAAAERFDHFGLCGDSGCGAVYSIVDGDLVARLDDLDGHPKSRAALVKRLAEELDALAKLKLRKGNAKRTKDWVRVEWLSEKIKAKTKEVASLRRMTMPAQLWCPFCLWEPPF